MRTSARNATLFIFFLFLFFNGVQVYLILQRIAGTKAKFNTACTNALLTTLFDYNKLKGTDSVAKPKNALISKFSIIENFCHESRSVSDRGNGEQTKTSVTKHGFA
jgi:hypothetical protein